MSNSSVVSRRRLNFVTIRSMPSQIRNIAIPLSQRERDRLDRLALRYGLSLPQLLRHVLEEIAAEVQEESFRDYEHPRTLRASFRRALRDHRAGRVRTRV